ncbi:MAG: hypothetical protein Q8P08_01945 [bacterium]|nr:hypothetical protein [bacterium]
MKRSKVIVSLLVVMSVIFFAGIAQAGGTNCPEKGFVPCGTEGCPCQLCDFFVMFDRIVDFFLLNIVPPIAVLMLVISGIMFFAAGGDPAGVGKAKKMLWSTLIGLGIIYGAFLAINTFLTVIGVAETGPIQEGWFKYPCF